MNIEYNKNINNNISTNDNQYLYTRRCMIKKCKNNIEYDIHNMCAVVLPFL